MSLPTGGHANKTSLSQGMEKASTAAAPGKLKREKKRLTLALDGKAKGSKVNVEGTMDDRESKAAWSIPQSSKSNSLDPRSAP